MSWKGSPSSAPTETALSLGGRLVLFLEQSSRTFFPHPRPRGGEGRTEAEAWGAPGKQPREQEKKRKKRGWRQASEAEEIGQASPPDGSRAALASQRTEDSGWQGGGAPSGQVCIVIVRLPPGQSRPESPSPRPRISPLTAPHPHPELQRKPNPAPASWPGCQPRTPSSFGPYPKKGQMRS